jgi:4-amino-4-deoxy-L-arabinose transferase-like glycosyltransferase
MRLNFTSYLKKYSFLFVILIAFLLRFWNLGITPPSLYWDEVSQAYNSYSILNTGYDEHKEFIPLARFQAFGDYKAPTYIYLDILPILLLGQTEFAVRLPSALFGSLTVVLAYFLSLEIFFVNKKKHFISVITSLMLAISPWHIQLSRVAYEANIATFFTIGGILFFFLGVRKNNNYLLLSIISFVLGFYSFNAHRIFIPLLFILLIIIYRKFLRENIKKVVLFGLIGLLFLLPFIVYFKSPESRLRFKEVNIFSDISVIEESNKLSAQDNNSISSKLLHNRRVLYGLSYAKHYFDFFSPTYLFFKGDVNPRFSTLDTGELYLYTFPFIILGMLAVGREKKKTSIFLLGWLLLSPIAGATARETPHALRSETFIPLYEIFIGFGFVWFYDFIHKYKRLRLPFSVLTICLVIFYLLLLAYIFIRISKFSS